MRKLSLSVGYKYVTLRFLHLCLLIVLVALVCTSCDHKELCYDHQNTARVNVIFDWRYAPSANPKSMMLHLFPASGAASDDFEFAGSAGSSDVPVASGRYTAIGISGSTYNLRYGSLDDDGLSLCENFVVETGEAVMLASLDDISEELKSRAPRAADAVDQRVALAPDEFWYDCLHDVTIYADAVNPSITLYPQQAHCYYTVKILNVENLEYASGFSGTISGLAGGVIPEKGQLTNEKVLVPFEMRLDQETSTVTGQTLTFGHCPDPYDDTVHTLTVYIVMSDGSSYYSNIDVTAQINSAPDPQNVDIVVDGLPLPEPSLSGGFLTTVESWHSVNFEIQM